MKFFNSSFPLLLFLSLLMIVFQGCEDGYLDMSACRKTVLGFTEERSFEISCEVLYDNGDPANNVTVVYEFVKEYCDGSLSGDYSCEDTPNENGYSNSDQVRNYKYSNENDKVSIKVYVKQYPNYMIDEVFYWEDVDETTEYMIDLANRKKVIKMYEIILPNP